MGLLKLQNNGNPKLKWDYYGTTKVGKIDEFMK